MDTIIAVALAVALITPTMLCRQARARAGEALRRSL